MRALQARQVLCKQRGELSPDDELAIQSPLRTLKSMFPNTPLAKHSPLDILITAPSANPKEPRALIVRDLGVAQSDWLAREFVLTYFEGKGISPPVSLLSRMHARLGLTSSLAQRVGRRVCPEVSMSTCYRSRHHSRSVALVITLHRGAASLRMRVKFRLLSASLTRPDASRPARTNDARQCTWPSPRRGFRMPFASTRFSLRARLAHLSLPHSLSSPTLHPLLCLLAAACVPDEPPAAIHPPPHTPPVHASTSEQPLNPDSHRRIPKRTGADVCYPCQR